MNKGLFVLMLIALICGCQFESNTRIKVESKPPILTFKRLADSLNLTPSVVKNCDTKFVKYYPGRDMEWFIDFDYEKLNDGLWQLVDSKTLKPYLIVEVENGKKNGLFAFGSSKSGIVTAIGQYKNNEREGYYRHFSDSGVRSAVSKYRGGIAIDTDYVYNITGALYELRILGSSGYNKIVTFDSQAQVTGVQFQYRDSNVHTHFSGGVLKYKIKVIYKPPKTIHTVFNTDGSIKSTATLKPQ